MELLRFIKKVSGKWDKVLSLIFRCWLRLLLKSVIRVFRLSIRSFKKWYDTCVGYTCVIVDQLMVRERYRLKI